MSLNSCTLNGFTLNSRRCVNKFLVLVDILHPPLPPVPPASQTPGGSPRVLRDVFADVPRPFEFDDRVPFTFEQPQITVDVEMFGLTGSQTLDNLPQADFVTVTGLTITAASAVEVLDLVLPGDDAVSVNISDITIDWQP